MSNNKLVREKEIANLILSKSVDYHSKFLKKPFVKIPKRFFKNDEIFKSISPKMFTLLPVLYLASNDEGEVRNLSIARMSKLTGLSHNTVVKTLDEFFNGVSNAKTKHEKRIANGEHFRKQLMRDGFDRIKEDRLDNQTLYRYKLPLPHNSNDILVFRRNIIREKWCNLNQYSHLLYFIFLKNSIEDPHFPYGDLCEVENTNIISHTHKIIKHLKPYTYMENAGFSKANTVVALKALRSESVVYEHPIVKLGQKLFEHIYVDETKTKIRSYQIFIGKNE